MKINGRIVRIPVGPIRDDAQRCIGEGGLDPPAQPESINEMLLGETGPDDQSVGRLPIMERDP